MKRKNITSLTHYQTLLGVSQKCLWVVVMMFLSTSYAQISGNTLHFSPLVEDKIDHSINKIIQDSTGYLWFATENGLARYDAYQIKVFKKEDNNPYSLLHNRVFDMAIDHKGVLWLATSGGICYFEAKKKRFVPLYPRTPTTKKDVFVQNVEIDIDKNVWFSTSALLWCWNPTTQVLDSVIVPKLSDKQGAAFIHTFICASNGSLYVSIDRAFYSYNPKNKKFTLLHAFPIEDADMLFNLVEDDQKHIWTCSRKGILHSYEMGKGNYTQHKFYGSSGKDTPVSNAFRTGNRDLFFHIAKNGLARFNYSTQKIESLQLPYFQLPDHQHIRCLFKDKQGIYWLGHEDIGVAYAYPYQNFEIINNSHASYTQLNSNICSTVLLSQNNTLWIGNKNGGLHRIASANGLESLQHERLFKANEILHLFEDNQQQVWVTSLHDGVAVFDKTRNRTKLYNNKNGFPFQDIRSVCQDQLGTVWLAAHGKGICSIDPKTDKITNYSSSHNHHLAPSGDWTFDILCDSKNRLWVASNLGLSMINTTRDSIQHFRHNRLDSTTIISNDLRALFEDSDGNIWCGSLEGISIYNPEKRKFQHILAYEGIFVLSFAEDNQGNLWAGSDVGLYQFNKNGQILNHYTTKNGLPSNSFLTNSVTTAKNGRLFFGTAKGIVSFMPSELEINRHPPKVLINTVMNNEMELEIDPTENSVFRYNQNNFSIHFSALSYVYPEHNSFAYRLIGLDTNWVYTTDRKTSFNNLAPGNYTFEVKAANNDGFWSTTSDTISFRITPPWWKTTVAYVVYFFIGLFSILTIYFIVRYRLKTNQELLIAKTKTTQLEELYESKINFFTNISHDIRTPLSLIYGPIESILRSGKLDASQHKLLSLVQRNTHQLLKLVNDLLDFKKLDTDNAPLQLDIVRLNLLLTQLAEDFKLPAFQKNIRFNIQLPQEDIIVKANLRLLERTLQNVLSNAFKFTPTEGNIAVKLDAVGSQAVLVVHDSGPGIVQGLEHKIFERFYEGNQSTGSGLGLFIVKKVMEQLGGSVQAHNQNGAVFTLTFPIYATDFQKDSIAYKEEKEDSTKITPLKSNTILVVEDNAELRNYICQTLSPYFTVVAAENGKKGYEMALNTSPDLVLTDVMMPEETGLTLCANIKNNLQTSHIPVIILTAKSGNIAEQEALQLGADDYIAKPFDPHSLVLKIRNRLQTKIKFALKSATETQDTSSDSQQSIDEHFINTFKQLVEQEISNADLSIEWLCEEMGLSRSQFYKKVHALTGNSPVDYIQELRLRQAMHLLQTTALNIAEIAYRVGYSDQRYFSNRFKKFTGKTPGDFRNYSN